VSPRAELRLAVVLCLSGSGLVLLAAGRGWLVATSPAVAPLPPRTVRLTGAVLTPLRPLGGLGLAGVVALAATRGLGRLLVGVVVLAAGAGAVAACLALLADPAARAAAHDVYTASTRTTGWPYAGLLGGVLLLAAGLLVAVRGRRWAALSRRYEAPGTREERPPARPEVAVWDALDRGEDPTRP
jgi:uncharacterized membrane protein (TIGR02234 family)